MFSLTSVQMQCLVKVIKYWRFCNTKHCTFFWVRLLLISVICQSLRLVILSKNIRRLKANKLNCNGKKYKSDVFLNWLFHMHILDVQVLRIIRCFTVGFIVKTYRNQLRTIPPTKDKCTAPTRFQSFQRFLPLWYISWGSFNSGFKTTVHQLRVRSIWVRHTSVIGKLITWFFVARLPKESHHKILVQSFFSRPKQLYKHHFKP